MKYEIHDRFLYSTINCFAHLLKEVIKICHGLCDVNFRPIASKMNI